MVTYPRVTSDIAARSALLELGENALHKFFEDDQCGIVRSATYRFNGDKG